MFLLKKRDYAGACHSSNTAKPLQGCAKDPGLRHENPGAEFATIREIAETEGTTQAASLQQRIVYLADIGMLSPMIGLLGTVLGIINLWRARPKYGKTTPGAACRRRIRGACGHCDRLDPWNHVHAFYAMFRGRVQSLISDLEIGCTHILGPCDQLFKTRNASRSAWRPMTNFSP